MSAASLTTAFNQHNNIAADERKCSMVTTQEECDSSASPLDFYDALNAAWNAISEKTRGVRAVLQVLRQSFEDDREGALERADIAALVGICLKGLPDLTREIDAPFTTIEAARIAERKETRERMETLERLRPILDSMRVVARLDASCEELSAAAATVFDIARADDAYGPDWLALKEIIEVRGLAVEVMTIGELCLGPRVSTKAMRKASRRADRAVASVARATAEEIALSKQVVTKEARP